MDGKSGSKRVSNHATIVVFAKKLRSPFYFLLHIKKTHRSVSPSIASCPRLLPRTNNSAEWRVHMNGSRRNADILKSQWDKSNKYDGYWRSKPMTQKQNQEEALGVRGKGFSVGNAMTDTNSIETIIEGLEKN